VSLCIQWLLLRAQLPAYLALLIDRNTPKEVGGGTRAGGGPNRSLRLFFSRLAATLRLF